MLPIDFTTPKQRRAIKEQRQVIADLHAVRDLVEHRWMAQGFRGSFPDGERYCVLGAISKVTGDVLNTIPTGERGRRVIAELALGLPLPTSSVNGLTEMNDGPGGHEAVRALVARTIDRLDPQAGLSGPAREIQVEPVEQPAVMPAEPAPEREPERTPEPVKTPEKVPAGVA